MKEEVSKEELESFVGEPSKEIITIDGFFEQFNLEILKEPYYAAPAVSNFHLDAADVSCARTADNFRTIKNDISTIHQNLVKINAYTAECCYNARSSCIESKISVVEKQYNVWVVFRVLNFIKETVNYMSNYVLALFDI